MVYRTLSWVWNRYRPVEGWLPLILLGLAVWSLISAVRESDWVPEGDVVIPAAVLGLLIGVILAKRPASGWLVWSLIALYGLLISFVYLASLWPALSTLRQGWEPTRQFWLQNGALFLDRVGGWYQAIQGGGRSHETLVFAFGLGLLAWFMAAYVGWSAFRQRRPLLGLTTMGVALAINGYYGEAQTWWAAVYVGFATLISALLHFANLERRWQSNQVDFSGEIRLDLIFYAGGIGLFLLVFALVLPAFRISQLTRVLLEAPAVAQAEDTLERVFAGVRQPRGGPDAAAGGLGRAGGLPRSYLLGNSPELYETVMMTATVSISAEDGAEIPATDELELLRGRHWRGYSYDVYTGRGWALSNEREEPFGAEEVIPLPPTEGRVPVSQAVSWLFGDNVIRYTLGLPSRFDSGVLVYWRGVEDLSRVARGEGEGPDYRAVSQMSIADPSALRATAVSDIPPAIVGRYTELPATVPARVHEMAQEIAGEIANPYDQARALERFLRQYPYSLDVELPPAGADPVDFFLFEAQTGYCDYYASAMTVMARSLALPARMGIGYLSQPADEQGVQTIYQINGHSWTEIYFAGYGWVEFEPTAAFASPHDFAASAQFPYIPEFETEPDPFLPDTPSIPQPEAQRPFPWSRAGLVSILILGLWLWLRRQEKRHSLDGVGLAYRKLQLQAQKLGHPLPASQTPYEFLAELLARLNNIADRPELVELVAEIRPHVERLTHLFVTRQYSQGKHAPAAAALQSWQRLRYRFWLIRFFSRLAGRRRRRPSL